MADVTLFIPGPLQPYADGRDRLRVQADTVAAALAAARAEYETLGQYILARDGRIRPYVNVFVRQTDIRELDGLDTKLFDGDEVIIMPSVAGG